MAYAGNDISILDNSIVVTNEDGNKFSIDTNKLKHNNSGSNIKVESPQVKELGDCLVIEYGRAWHDVEGSAREITLPGNVYLYSISKRQEMAKIENLAISEYLEISRGHARKKSALIISTNENFIEKQYEITSECTFTKSSALPPMELYDAFSINGTVYAQGYCSSDNPQCIAVYNSRGTTVYGVYNKAQQADSSKCHSNC